MTRVEALALKFGADLLRIGAGQVAAGHSHRVAFSRIRAALVRIAGPDELNADVLRAIQMLDMIPTHPEIDAAEQLNRYADEWTAEADQVLK